MIVFAKNTNLQKFQYSQLPETSRPAARQAVLNQEIKAQKRAIAEAKRLARENIHQLVNNPYHRIPALLRYSQQIRRNQSDTTRFEKVIDDNYCLFLENGAYVLFMPHKDEQEG